MSDILNFTAAAVEHINKSLTRFPNGGFRLSVKKAGCTGNKYVPEIAPGPKSGDEVFVTEQGLRVFIDSASKTAIQGTQVDIVNKGLGQKQLVFKNPNAVSECGCGESFHLKEDAHD